MAIEMAWANSLLSPTTNESKVYSAIKPLLPDFSSLLTGSVSVNATVFSGVFSDSGLVAALRADFLLVEGTDASALSQVSSEKDRPLFVCADFAPNSALAAAALRLPNVQGLLDGRAHRWRSSIVPTAVGRAIHALSLPSAGGAGDIGHVLLRLTRTGATAELHQADFLPPSASAAEAHPADWSAVVAANQGARCRFVWG